MTTLIGNFINSLFFLFQLKKSHILQIVTLLFLLCVIFMVGKVNTYICAANFEYQPLWKGIDTYGLLGFTLLFSLKLLPCLSLPFAVINIFSLFLTNVWPNPPKLEIRQSDIPLICFRVVTRGLYKSLVVKCLQRNIKTCQRIGLEKFKFEIVTDIPLNLKTSMFIREIVVPHYYKTRNNSLYKARALHYCLEDEINILSSDDWIVHLDEETILTEGSVIGLANFAAKNIGSIGQGVITYANDGIVNWFTTLADSIRVSIDISLMKFCFQKLHRPVFGLKGSYIIMTFAVEKDIGFDFGPRGSIAEDFFFALLAWTKGYKFNFVEGEMWEKSPFTIVDYLKQRKRWFVGRMYTLLSPNISMKCKITLIPTDLSWLLLTLNLSNFLFSFLFPLQTPNVILSINSMVEGLMIFLFAFGSIKSFSLKRYGFWKKTFICMCTVLIIPFTACLDGIASLCGFWGKFGDGFYIVEKEKDLPLKNNHEEFLA